MKQLLQRLTDAFGPSGHEDAIRELIRREVRGLADEVRTDALGNLIVHKRPSAAKGARDAAVKIMIAAHMDEIGLAATHIDSKGFVRFTSVGGIYPRNLPGARCDSWTAPRAWSGRSRWSARPMLHRWTACTSTWGPPAHGIAR